MFHRNNKAIIIAECCQNHNGSFETLRKMVHEAAEAGADYVKIQSIRSHQLTHRPKFDTGAVDERGNVLVIKRPFEPEKERLSKLDLALEDEQKFIKLCKSAGIKAMTTPFARETLKEIAELKFDAIKVASYDCGALPFVKEILTGWQKVFISTGATLDEELESTAKAIRDYNREVWLLHCVTIYPTPVKEMNLARLQYLKMFADKIGLSSHPKTTELGIEPDMVALAMGADCVERHYTVLAENETKDGPVSITPKHLKKLREFADRPIEERKEIVRSTILNWPDYLGVPLRELSRQELLNRDYYRGRFASKNNRGEWVYNWEDKLL